MEYMEYIFSYVLREKGGTYSRKLLIILLLDIDLINNANRSITPPHHHSKYLQYMQNIYPGLQKSLPNISLLPSAQIWLRDDNQLLFANSRSLLVLQKLT